MTSFNRSAEKHWYKDFVTDKRRFTRGRFIGWSAPTGPLNAVYAGFQLRSEILWVPRYLLENKTPQKPAIP